MVYCSRDCAPFGNYGLSHDTSSENQTGKSILRVVGAGSQKSNAGKNKDDYATRYRKDVQNALNRKEITTTQTKSTAENGNAHSITGTRTDSTSAELKEQKPKEQNEMKSNAIGTIETERTDSSKSLPAVSSVTHQNKLDEQLQNLSQARLLTMNTIDESATLLLDCMKSAAKRGSSQEAPRDYRDLNAIANLGKQVAQLAKVKLDILKEARKP